MVGLLVEHRNRLHHFGRKGAEGKFGVIFEERLAIDEHFLDRFALRLYTCVGHLDTRHLGDKVFGSSSVGHLVGISIIDNGVAHLLETLVATHGLDLCELLGIFLQLESTNLRTTSREERHILGEHLVAHVGHFKGVLSGMIDLKSEIALSVANAKGTCASIGRGDLHGCTHQGVICFTINDRSLGLDLHATASAGLCERHCCACNKNQDNRQQTT